MQARDTLTVAEAAARLGVSVDTVRRRAQAGRLETVPLERGYAVVLEGKPDDHEGRMREVIAERDRLIEQVAFLQRQLEEASRAQAALIRLLESQRQSSAAPKAP